MCSVRHGWGVGEHVHHSAVLLTKTMLRTPRPGWRSPDFVSLQAVDPVRCGWRDEDVGAGVEGGSGGSTSGTVGTGGTTGGRQVQRGEVVVADAVGGLQDVVVQPVVY